MKFTFSRKQKHTSAPTEPDLLCPRGLNGALNDGTSRILYLRVEHKAWKCCGDIPVQKLIHDQNNISINDVTSSNIHRFSKNSTKKEIKLHFLSKFQLAIMIVHHQHRIPPSFSK